MASDSRRRDRSKYMACDFKIRFNGIVFWMCLLFIVTSARWQVHF